MKATWGVATRSTVFPFSELLFRISETAFLLETSILGSLISLGLVQSVMIEIRMEEPAVWAFAGAMSGIYPADPIRVRNMSSKIKSCTSCTNLEEDIGRDDFLFDFRNSYVGMLRMESKMKIEGER
jgi:hypothetical protein